jgi:hypothetical protein
MARKIFQQAPLVLLAAGLIACATAVAMAEGVAYCVTCTGPDQTYLCRVDAAGARATDAFKLYCVMRTAKEGHHASCSAERASASCHGLEKVYSYDGPLPEDLASEPHVKRLTDKIEQNQKAFEKPNSGGPKTLVELGGRAVSASRRGWRNARDRLSGSSSADVAASSDAAPAPLTADTAETATANGASAADTPPHEGFAKRSYRCVLSLFRNCRS